jgi:hypothetical protein
MPLSNLGLTSVNAVSTTANTSMSLTVHSSMQFKQAKFHPLDWLLTKHLAKKLIGLNTPKAHLKVLL